MIGRLLEDGIWLGRFLYNYYKAPALIRSVGFYSVNDPIPKRERLRMAWHETNGYGKQRPL